MEVSAREFRMHMKDYLDRCLKGETIYINRGGVLFVLAGQPNAIRVHGGSEPVYTPVAEIA